MTQLALPLCVTLTVTKSVTGEGWNRRYLAYCRAQGTPDPDAMIERDHERWPGGPMTGYILWIRERWAEWATANKRDRNHLTDEDHAAFDAWLADQPAHQEGR